MEESELKTKYAPAERASSESIYKSFNLLKEMNLLERLFAVVPNVVLILNKERQTVFCNQTLLELLSLNSYDEVLGKRPGEILNCIHSSEMPYGCGTTEFCSTCGAVNAILNTQKTLKRTVNECRVLVKRNDAIEALDLQVVTNVIEIDGETYISFHITDISDEKRRKVLEKIFFHDVLNTAGIISGISEVIDQIEDKNLFKEFMTQLNLTSHRLIEEIQAQRLLLQAENNELQLNKKIINSISFLKELISEYSYHETAKNKSLVLNKESEDFIFITDSTILGRVLGNLIKNALEASKSKDIVTISCKNTLTGHEFSVHNISFIPKEIQLQIFQRSFSTKGSNRGIGTYSIKLLTEKYLNGKVWFKSNEETGTTFYISLPKEKI